MISSVKTERIFDDEGEDACSNATVNSDVISVLPSASLLKASMSDNTSDDDDDVELHNHSLRRKY